MLTEPERIFAALTNSSVAHWKGRAEAAESERDRLISELREARGAIAERNAAISRMLGEHPLTAVRQEGET